MLMIRDSYRWQSMAITNPYRAQWDAYVEGWSRAQVGDFDLPKENWPGDEWGKKTDSEQIFRFMFLDFGARNWRHCVEIGAGSGKYTRLLLDYSASNIVAFDISPAFLDVLRRRLETEIKAGLVIPVLLEGKSSSEILDFLDHRGLTGRLDCFYSINAMVHVTLQHLITYLLTAAIALRKGGVLLLTLPNATSDEGFATLLDDARRCYSQQRDPNIPRFEWLGPELVGDLLAQLGFNVQFVLPFGGKVSEYRDLHVAATLTDLSQIQRFRNAIASRAYEASERSSTDVRADSLIIPGSQSSV
jgi:SAM-dependent methyltransferase